ncbi:hypothetical protein SISNIDRAFT_394455, partial [Sistotremastrum niveocremeum HHB9708]
LVAVAMPFPGTRGAPKFDGTPSDLPDFLREFETCAQRANLTPEIMTETVSRYAEKKSRKLWERLPGYGGNNWEAYKARILQCYPQVDQNRLYSRKDLVNLVRKMHKKKMKNLDHFTKYDNKFNTIALWLRSANLISSDQIDSLYAEGFP